MEDQGEVVQGAVSGAQTGDHPESGPLTGPLAEAINRKQQAEGGGPLRHKMVDGRAQFWVEDAVGRVTAAHTLRDLAIGLGIAKWGSTTENAMPKQEQKNQMISIQRAAKLTGYSASALNSACNHGELRYLATKGGGRFRMIDRDEALAWARNKIQKGGAHAPRARRKIPKVATPARPAARPAAKAAPGDRLAKLLERFKGTPLEMSREEFVKRAIDQAIARMGG